jgi:hypothetical protein
LRECLCAVNGLELATRVGRLGLEWRTDGDPDDERGDPKPLR